MPEQKYNQSAAWIGVDLDGTLAEYNGWKGLNHIGQPIQRMVDRVKLWLNMGINVKIFTARASEPEAIPVIESWLDSVGLSNLEITNIKDYHMIQLWDDRCVAVAPNLGEPLHYVNWPICESRYHPDPMNNEDFDEQEIKYFFHQEFVEAYLEHMDNDCPCGGRDIKEVLYMAFTRGYNIAKPHP